MKNPGLQFRLVRLVGAIFLALSSGVRAEPPPGKPQVIYHVRRTSNYAATLHSQAKNPNSEFPVENNPSTSPPIPRPTVNPPAARPEVQPQRQAPASKRNINRPKIQKNQFARPPRSMKATGHGNKSHKR
jgi:hypothetical protein